MGEQDDIQNWGSISRRRFLGAVGAGAVSVGTAGAVRVPDSRAARAAPAAHGRHAEYGVTRHFGRMFERLAPFVEPDGTAVIGDPRNDEHVVIAGLQVKPNKRIDTRTTCSRRPNWSRTDSISDPSAAASSPR